jgi:hypothetical protein
VAQLVVTGIPRGLPAEREVALLRVTQEALTNVRRHAAASRVEVDLAYRPDGVSLRVCDDGCGFDPDAPRSGDGLAGMRARATRVGGVVSVTAAPGAGWWSDSTCRPGRVSAMTVRVLIVDDHPIVREGLRGVLSAEPDLVVVGECGRGDDAVRTATSLRPDVGRSWRGRSGRPRGARRCWPPRSPLAWPGMCVVRPGRR